jgi:iron(III) transport system ATP-binding protein
MNRPDVPLNGRVAASDVAKPPSQSSGGRKGWIAGSVRLSDVVHGYSSDQTVVDRVSLEIGAGDVHCLLGESGSGKTTLLRLIAGLEHVRGGEIWIGGELVASPAVHRPPERRSIGYVFQDFALFPHMSVVRNVMYGMPSAPRQRRIDAARRWLARVGLVDRSDAMPHMLSGGQQQRIALIRALAREPAVMLLDEPFSGLDVELRERIREETLSMLRDAGVTTLMVTHDPHEAFVSADKISVMQGGRIIAQGSPSEVCHVATLASGLQVVRVNVGRQRPSLGPQPM